MSDSDLHSLLSDEDREYLDANHHECWKLVSEGDKYGIIISDYGLPSKYTPEQSDLMIIIPNNYPAEKLDMFYFDPKISRKDGKEISHLADENHFDRDWQRWSKHYPEGYDWDPCIDNVGRHISFVENVLENE